MSNPHERYIYDIHGKRINASESTMQIKPPSKWRDVFKAGQKNIKDIEVPIVAIDQEGASFTLSSLRSGTVIENTSATQYQVYLAKIPQEDGIEGYYIYPDTYLKGSVAMDLGMAGIKTLGDFFAQDSDQTVTIGSSFTFQIIPRIPQEISHYGNTVVFNSYFIPGTRTIDEVTSIKIAPVIE